jgi:predicted DNA-binding transcriptional regulator AlpA
MDSYEIRMRKRIAELASSFGWSCQDISVEVDSDAAMDWMEDQLPVHAEALRTDRDRVTEELRVLQLRSDLQAEMIEGYQADVLGRRLLDDRELASMLGVSREALGLWRAADNGPKYIDAGKYLRYRLSDVDAWLASARAWAEYDERTERA